MREYCRISPLFWVKGTGKLMKFNEDARVLALYLMTSPDSTMMGLYFISVQTMSGHLGWKHDRLAVAMSALEKERFAHYDFDAGLVFLPEGARWQMGRKITGGDKRRRSVENQLETFDHHAFHDMFVRRYGDAYGLSSEEQGRSWTPNAPEFTCPSPDADKVHQPTEIQSEMDHQNSKPMDHQNQLPQVEMVHRQSTSESTSESAGSSAGGPGDAEPPPAKKPKRSPQKQFRLPEGWQPSQKLREQIHDPLHGELPDDVIDRQIPEFIDHWRAATGKGTRKDANGWESAFRKWCRNCRKYADRDGRALRRYQPPPPEPTPLELEAERQRNAKRAADRAEALAAAEAMTEDEQKAFVSMVLSGNTLEKQKRAEELGV